MTSTTEKYTQLILEVFSLHQQLIIAGDGLSAPFALTSAKWKVLGGIALSEKPPTVSQVARKMGLSRQSVQRLCNDLRAFGMLNLLHNPKDKRACCWQLSAKGWDSYRQVMQAQEAWIEQISQGIDLDEVTESTKFLKQFSSCISREFQW